MPVLLDPYCAFRDTAEEAVARCRPVFGGEPAVTRFGEYGDDEALLRRGWDGLSTGGTITVPPEPAPWGGLFGMCTDRFGIHRMPGIGDGPS